MDDDLKQLWAKVELLKAQLRSPRGKSAAEADKALPAPVVESQPVPESIPVSAPKPPIVEATAEQQPLAAPAMPSIEESLAKPLETEPPVAGAHVAAPDKSKSAKAKPSAAEMLAQARAKKAPAVTSPAVQIERNADVAEEIPAAPKTPVSPAAVDESPAKSPAVGKPSVAEMLAKARAGKPAVSEKPADEASPEQLKPAAEKPAAPPKPAPLDDFTAARRAIWQRLPADVRLAVEAVALSGQADEPTQRKILAALNQLLKDRELLATDDLAAVFERAPVQQNLVEFPKQAKGIQKDWSELQVRAGGRLALQAIYGGLAQRRVLAGPPRTLAYLSRGDIFGETGVLLKRPRSATCIAYDHPLDDPSRLPGRVELVRIAAEVFERLVEKSHKFLQRVSRIAAENQARSRAQPSQKPWDEQASFLASAEFQELGLIQGQELLLIDLDRCTRCGECVTACINTHDDGFTRLFLDGPRFDRFLVPSACRKCLNPSCMIGCPVGSIQRGDNGQIVIRDWCIGCNMCAKQCPYDSIQMHDIGILPERSHGWRVTLASDVEGSTWMRPGYRDGGWREASAPFTWDLDFPALLAAKSERPLNGTLEQAVCFRRHFRVRLDHRQPNHFRLFIVAQGTGADVWLNGQPLTIEQEAKQKKKGEFECKLPPQSFHNGDNVFAIRVQPPVRAGQTVLSLRLDQIPNLAAEVAETAELKLVTKQAVVCDLCSSLPSQRPACVDQCPHNAAFRIDARRDLSHLAGR